MDRLAWITAACLIDKHRENALPMLEMKLKELDRDRALGGPRDEFEFWCATAAALMEILRGTREAGEAVH
jgi:hypothetical protein